MKQESKEGHSNDLADVEVAINTGEFGPLFERYKKYITHYCLPFVGNVQDAEDVMIIAMHKASRALATKYDKSRPFLPWLCSIARNTCKDHLKKPRLSCIPIEDNTPEQKNCNPGGKHDLESLLSTLSIEEREIIVLHVLNGYTLKETERITGLPYGTIHYKKKAILAKLSALMECDGNHT